MGGIGVGRKRGQNENKILMYRIIKNLNLKATAYICKLETGQFDPLIPTSLRHMLTLLEKQFLKMYLRKELLP